MPRPLTPALWAAFALPLALPAQAQGPAAPTAPAAPAVAPAPAGTLEAIGAQKCGGSQAAIEVEFMAPEEASLVANAAVTGTERAAQATAALALDGKECGEEGCSFRAVKGQRYRLVATRLPGRAGELCVSVTRP